MSDDEDFDPEAEEEEEEKELDLATPDVVTKYKAAAEITNRAMELVISELKVGEKIIDICVKADEFITTQCAGVFNKKNDKGEKLEKGPAFPTCISLNSTVCHYSPLAGDETKLAAGDLAKIDLGCHIDGFIAVCAHTICVQEDSTAPVTGAAADLISACGNAVEVALRMMKPGCKASDISDTLNTIAESFGVKVVEGVLSHQLKRFVIDGNKVILSKPGPETKVEEAVFEENEVYALDMVFSTGEGKPKLLDEKATTVYKRDLSKEYNLKMKASRAVFSEVNKKFPTLPFTVRCLEEPVKARLGLMECLSHDLLHPYPVLHEKTGSLVAQFKSTVLIMPNAIDKITGGPLKTQTVETEKKIEDEEILKTLQASLKMKKAKKKAKAEAAAPAAAPEEK